MISKNIAKQLHVYERKVISFLVKKNKTVEIQEIIKDSNLKDLEVMRALQWLSNKKLVDYEKKENVIVSVNKELLKNNKLPELKFLNILLKLAKKSLEFVETAKLKKELTDQEFNISLGILKKNNAIVISKKNGKLSVALTDNYKAYMKDLEDVEKFLSKLPSSLNELSQKDKEYVKNLSKRNVVRKEIEKYVFVQLTKLGLNLAKNNIKDINNYDLIENINEEIIRNKTWKKKEIRFYDISINVPKIYGGRKHPLTAIMDMIRDIFVEMGFSEMKGPWVETSFWCFDSMWIPQDHPAREVQDTFYLPYDGKLPNKKLVNKVIEVHETGGKTGSKGYGYKWNPEMAKQLLLRTHTTATTYRYFANKGIAKMNEAKYFYIGRVFRNEAIDATHLPEFHQVEGFVMADGLNLKHLMAFIKTFYSKMGIDKIKFKLTYNPYTEPSLEALYYNPKRKKWLELINSGLFRPESLAPYDIKKPVIAWGLGVERLAMTLYELDKLKDLLGTNCDLSWLRTYEMKIRDE